MKQKFHVTGMTCSACSAAVENSVKKVDGVQEVQVNLLTNSMTVEYAEGDPGTEAILTAVKKAGYGANLYGSEPVVAVEGQTGRGQFDEEIRALRTRFLVSLVFLLPLFYIAMGHMLGLPLPSFIHGTKNAIPFAFSQFLLVLPIAYVNRKYYRVGLRTLFLGKPNMDTLIAIGSGAAILYGIAAIWIIGYGLGHEQLELVERYQMELYFETAGMILTLITLGKFLEAKSKGRTSEAISKMIALAPKMAIVERDGVELEVPVEELAVGDRILVKAGATIPVDGVVVEGHAVVDQSAITGESLPVEKQAADRVIAATINRSGFIKFVAEKVGEDTTLAQIIRLMEEAGASKAPIAKLADRVSGIFVPIVLTIAALSGLLWFILGQSFEFSLSIVIAVLVISCPCALGLATPVAIMVGTGKGATGGILIRSAEALETAHRIDTVVLDKTGTLTEGKPVVTDLFPAEGTPKGELLAIAAALEKPSEHPLGQAIVEKADLERIGFKTVRMFEQLPGKGVRGEVDGAPYYGGNSAMMQDLGVDLRSVQDRTERLAQEGKTVLYFSGKSRLLGTIAVADVVKPTSKAAVTAMKDLGLDVVMMTGDNRITAEAIQRQLGVNTVLAEVLPQDKEGEVRRLQELGRHVAMVGDGINDAPALKRADVGIAIGAGTDIAIESADMVLMRSDPQDIVSAIRLSKATLRNIKQNLFWAFFYNVIGIPLAAGLFYPLLEWRLNPMFAAAAMSLSSVFVVTNALRLNLFRLHPSTENTNKRSTI